MFYEWQSRPGRLKAEVITSGSQFGADAQRWLCNRDNDAESHARPPGAQFVLLECTKWGGEGGTVGSQMSNGGGTGDAPLAPF